MATDDLSRVHIVRGRRFLFQVETSGLAADYGKYEDLRRAIWGFADDPLPGARNMLCENFLQDGSSLFLAVYADDEQGRLAPDAERCVGFSYGFVGLKDKAAGFRSPDNLWFYSQYAGVREDFRSFGLGVLLKEFQRDVLLRVLGIDIVVCTYDPLTGVNARRNVHHFGMRVAEYRRETYGEFGGLLNRRDVPSDRLFMSWDLTKVHRPSPDGAADPPGTGRPLSIGRRRIRGRSGPLEVEVVERTDLSGRAAAIVIPVPEDFYVLLRETDVEDPDVRRIPLDWRLRTREAFETFFREGYSVADFRRRGSENFYVLEAPSDGPRPR